MMPGSKIYKCYVCGVDCSCSLVGQKRINEEGALPYCPRCGTQTIMDQVAQGDKPEFVDASEAFRTAVAFLKNIKNN
jgi:hypothetical protein